MIGLLALALGLTSASRTRTDFPLQDGNVNLHTISQSDALSIVRPLARLPLSTRPGHLEGVIWSINIDTARVISSPTLKMGSTLKIVVPWSVDDGQLYELRRDKTYLVLAARASNGHLSLPYGESDPKQSEYPSADPSEVGGYAVFETHQIALSKGTDAVAVALNSISDCFVGADRAGIDRVSAFFGGVAYREMRSFPFGRPDFELSLKLKSVAKDGNLYLRFKIFQLLNDWHVFGASDDYMRATAAFSRDPSAFSGPDEIHDLYFYEDTFYQSLPKGFKHTLGGDEWAATVIRATNQKVLRFLLRNPVHDAAESYLPALAKLLKSPDDQVRLGIVCYLCWANHETTHQPRQEEHRDADGVRILTYPDLTQMVDYWKAKYGI